MTAPLPEIDLIKIRKTQEALSTETDALNVTIDRVECALRDLRLGVRASVTFPNGDKLSFSKYGDHWRLMVDFDSTDQNSQPLRSASREMRILAGDLIPHLLQKLIDAIASERTRVSTANEKLITYIDTIHAAIDEEKIK